MIDEPIVCREIKKVINKKSVSFKAIIFDSGLRHLQRRRIKFTSISSLNWELINICFHFLHPSLFLFFSLSYDPFLPFSVHFLSLPLTTICYFFVSVTHSHPLSLSHKHKHKHKHTHKHTHEHTHKFTHAHFFLQPFIFPTEDFYVDLVLLLLLLVVLLL